MKKIHIQERYAMNKAGLLLFLIISAGLDIKRKEVSMVLTGLFAAAAVICNLAYQQIPVIIWVCGILPGIFFLAAGLARRGAVGSGDGFVIAVCGLFLGIWGNIQLLLIALFLSALYSMVLIVVKKVKRSHTIAFIPFLLLGYVIMLTFAGGEVY